MNTWMTSICGLLFGVMAWSQTPQFPVTPILAPGTAELSPVLLTTVPTGYSAEIVSTTAQRCSLPENSPQTTASASSAWECRTLSGNPRLLARQGTLLTRSGDTLLASEREMRQGTAVIGTIMDGVDVLEEGVQTAASISSLVRVESPELTCVASQQAGVSIRTQRAISGFVFNEPLNVLYVETIHSKTYYATTGVAVPGSGGSCGAANGATGTTAMEVPVLQDTTRTLLRVRGFNNARPSGM